MSRSLLYTDTACEARHYDQQVTGYSRSDFQSNFCRLLFFEGPASVLSVTRLFLLSASSSSSSLDEEEDEDEEELLLEEDELLLEEEDVPDWSSPQLASSETTLAKSGRCCFRIDSHLADIFGRPLLVCFQTCKQLKTWLTPFAMPKSAPVVSLVQAGLRAC